jgi:pimeloyl-ACP methyl ester carboxylesterase
VKVPTLVLHCRNDAAVTFDEGRRLAAGIPGAKFVTLESRNHLVLETEPAWEKFSSDMTAATCDPGNIARLQSKEAET